VQENKDNKSLDNYRIKAGKVRIIRAVTEAIIRAGQKGTVGIIRTGN
jgi:hypothetical protein